MFNRKLLSRAILLGFLLTPIHSYLIVKLEIIFYRGGTSASPIFWTTILNLLLLVLFNIALIRLSPKYQFQQQELLVIYVMTNIATCLVGHDMLQILVPMLGHPFWFATPENEWQDLFWSYLPKWLVVSNRRALHGYYYGESSLYTVENFKAWLEPMLWWCGFVFLLVFTLTCINLLFRKQWTEVEKLSYPMIQLPLQMTDPLFRFYRNRSTWYGFIAISLINTMNSLHVLYPPIPQIPYWVRNYAYLLTERPWNAIHLLFIGFNPDMIGLGFIIPEDLCFSLWFFHWFWKTQQVIGSILGIRSLPNFPYGREQASGAYLAIGAILLYMNRHHLNKVVLTLVRSTSETVSATYRYAMIGILLGFGLITLFCYYGGMQLWVIIVFFMMYFIIQLAITRMRAELGTPVHDLHYSGPDEILVRTLGTRRLGNGTLVMFSFFWFINRAYRSNVMAHEMEGLKMAERVGINTSTLIFAVMLTGIWGALTAFWAMLHQGYTTGMQVKAYYPAIGAFGYEPWNRLAFWMQNRTTTDLPGTSFMAGGFLFTIILAIMRFKFIWWRFHPAGYAVSNSYNMEVLWSPLFFGWLAKFMILKFGGLKLYRKTLPFFLGLILGHFASAGIWIVVGVIIDQPM